MATVRGAVVRVVDEQELRDVLEECRRELVGGRVENVHQSDASGLVVTLYLREKGKRFLFLCSRPRLARFHLLAVRPQALERPPVFCEIARKKLKGRWLVALRTLEPGCGGEFRFAERYDCETGDGAVDLRLCCDGPGRGLVLFDARGREVLAALDSRVSVGDRVDDTSGADWQGPASECDVADSGGAPPLDAPASARLEARFDTLQDQVVVEERRRDLERAVKQEVKRRARTLLRVEEDLAKAQRGEEQRICGELLQAALGNVKRGMTEVEVVNYFDPQMPKLRIALDPSLGPQENLKRYFKRYQKAKRAVPFVEERLSRLSGELSVLRNVLERLRVAEEPGELSALEDEARGLLKRRRAPAPRSAGRAKGEVAEPLGPRRFLSADGYEILVGRNAKGNDRLTMRIARGNDLFLHVAGRPGAHVVVRTQPGKSVPQPTLIDAAQLALYYSLAEKLRRVGGAEARGEVDYTPAKYVQKPKGTRPGLVYLSQHKTLHVQLDLRAMDRLMHSTEGES